MRVLAFSPPIALGSITLGAHDLLPARQLLRRAGCPGDGTRLQRDVREERERRRAQPAWRSLVGPQGRQAIDKQNWTEVEPQSTVTVTVGGTGTYVLGAAVQPRVISMEAAEFNGYLKEDGIDQALADRTAKGKLNEPAKERYAKDVKALVQVGPSRTNAFATVLGHQAEIVPVENPFAMAVGGTLAVRALVMGKPLPRYAVFAGGRSGESDIPVQRLTTDEQGVARVRLTHPGAWYVKFIHMEEVTDGSATHESRWATLSFAVR